MKKTVLLCLTTGLLMAACNQPAEKTEEQPAEVAAPAVAEEPMEMPDSATMAKMWMEAMTPGDMHAVMAERAGKWKAEITSWNDPSAPPITSSVDCEIKMIMGGRYESTRFEGNMMGMPFEGNGILAYDNIKKKFIGTWIDNTGTGVMISEGDYDAANKQFDMKGTVSDIMTGKDKSIREVNRKIDDNNWLMEMYELNPDGSERKTLEIKFTRA